jgi:ribosomal protein S18 acetylase RimI-like enzyme
MNIIVERMKESDIEDVRALGISTKELQIDDDKSMYYGSEELKAAVKSENEICLVARVDGQFAGFRLAHFNPIFREAYLSDTAIKKEFQGLGIGQLIYQKTNEILKEKNADWSWAIVHEDNERMMNFMKKQGYKKGRKFYFYYK